jgi:putative transposase
MASTFSQVHLHFVFAVQGRVSLIREDFRDELEKYITGIVQERQHKMLAIYCMPDHIHFLIGKRPNQAESDLVRDIKASSSGFIHQKKWLKGRFEWQEGYGVFSYSKSQVNDVIAYILNQPEHHKKNSFKKEFMGMLKRHEMEFDERYLFEWIEDA